MSELSREEWAAACLEGERIASEAILDAGESLGDGTSKSGAMLYGACLGLITETSRIMRAMVMPTPEGYANLEMMVLACTRGACRGLDYPVDAAGEKIEEMQ